MTPKQKAEELVEKFYKNGAIDWENAKQCSIICCQEVIDNINWMPYNNKCNMCDETYNRIKEGIDYWQEVKRIIEEELS